MQSPRTRPLLRLAAGAAGLCRRGFTVMWLAGSSCLWAAADITLTIDCAFCGPGQTFPHDCPRVNSSAAALSTAEAFSSLVATARKEVGQLRGVGGMSIPDLGEVGSLAQLDLALANVIAATEEEIARSHREQAEFLRQSENAGMESARLEQLATDLAAEIAHTGSAIAATESEVAAAIRAASAARDETVALQKSLNLIRSEVTKVRNQLFPRLHQAAHRGWILPPSSYRPLPGPLAPVKEHRGSRFGDLAPAAGTPLPMGASTEDIAVSRVTPATMSSLGTRPRWDVQAKLDQLPDLLARARAAAGRREEALRSLERRRSESDDRSARLSALQPQRTAAAHRLAGATRNLEMARGTKAQYGVRLNAARAAAVHAWIEWGIFCLLDEKASLLPAGSDVAPIPDPAFLENWRHLAATAVRLGSEPLAVIAQFPAAAAARGESLEELQRDLAGAREKFGLSAAVTHPDLPPTTTPYLAKDGR